MKKVVSLILVVLTIITVMFVGSVSVSASGGLVRPRETTVHTSAASVYELPTPVYTETPDKKATPLLGVTINEMDSSTYIIVAAGIFVVAMGLGILIGYNIKKKKPAVVSSAEKEGEE